MKKILLIILFFVFNTIIIVNAQNNKIVYKYSEALKNKTNLVDKIDFIDSVSGNIYKTYDIINNNPCYS